MPDHNLLNIPVSPMITKFVSFRSHTKVKLVEKTRPALLQQSHELIKSVVNIVVKILLLVSQRFTGQLYGLDTFLDARDFVLDISH